MKKSLKKIFEKKLPLLLSSIGIVFVAISVIAVISLTKKDLEELIIENDEVYIYFGEEKFEFKSKATLYNDKGITSLLLDEKKVELQSEPIYYKKRVEALFPQKMSVVFPITNGMQKKVNYYTSIEKNGEDFYLKNKDLDYKISSSFLYDGNDLYFFIEDTKIVFGEVEINIPRFSYVINRYKGELYIYDYSQDNMMFFEQVNEDVYAISNNYKINISIDSLILNNKTKLLMKNLDYLKNLK